MPSSWRALNAGAKYLGGGTNLVDLMRETIEEPHTLIDVTALSKEITARDDGSILIGAASHEHRVVGGSGYPRSGFQCWRERCWRELRVRSGTWRRLRETSFSARDVCISTTMPLTATSANAGAGCDALNGFNRMHAILGASDACIATHPSDMCVALAALDAIVHVEGPSGARQIKLTELHRLPGNTPHRETELEPLELITAVEVPACEFAHPVDVSQNPRPIELRVRARLRRGSDGCDLGWRHSPGTAGTGRRCSQALARHQSGKRAEGASASTTNFREAAEAELADARPHRDNAFKVELAQTRDRVVSRRDPDGRPIDEHATACEAGVVVIVRIEAGPIRAGVSSRLAAR